MSTRKPTSGSFKKGHKTWTQGLTKETDERIRAVAEKNKIWIRSTITKEKMSVRHKGIRVSPATEFKSGAAHPNKNQIMKKRISSTLKRKYSLGILKISEHHRNLLRTKLIERMKNGEFNIKPNKPEKILTQLFQENNLPFEYTGDGKFWIGYSNPDFVWEKGKKIIEFDGKYWHSIPRQIIKDEERNIEYLNDGYDVMLINEDNLKDELCLIDSIKKFIEDV